MFSSCSIKFWAIILAKGNCPRVTLACTLSCSLLWGRVSLSYKQWHWHAPWAVVCCGSTYHWVTSSDIGMHPELWSSVGPRITELQAVTLACTLSCGLLWVHVSLSYKQWHWHAPWAVVFCGSTYHWVTSSDIGMHPELWSAVGPRITELQAVTLACTLCCGLLWGQVSLSYKQWHWHAPWAVVCCGARYHWVTSSDIGMHPELCSAVGPRITELQAVTLACTLSCGLLWDHMSLSYKQWHWHAPWAVVCHGPTYHSGLDVLMSQVMSSASWSSARLLSNCTRKYLDWEIERSAEIIGSS